MAIKTSTFEGWHLTGEDAVKFRKQIEEDTAPNKEAEASLIRGKKLSDEYVKNGFVVLTSNKKYITK